MSSLLGGLHAPSAILTTETAHALVGRMFAVSKSIAAKSGGSQPPAIRSMSASSPHMATMSSLVGSPKVSPDWASLNACTGSVPRQSSSRELIHQML
jgi:hypothetical protein